MADIVNLRRERKRKRREESAKAAAANRAKHGASAAERASVRLAKRMDEKRFEAHRREPPNADD
jgi:hypothetical protein